MGGTRHGPQPLGARHQNLARTTLPSSTCCHRGYWCCLVPVLVSWGCRRAASLLPGQGLGFLTSLPALQYFPGRPCVQTYLQSLDGWLRNWTEPELPRSALKEAMKNNRDVRHPWTPFPLSLPPCIIHQLHHAMSVCPPGLPPRCAPDQRDLGGLPGQ